MAKLPQQLYVVHSTQSQSQSIRCDFCGGDLSNGHFSYQNNSHEAEDPSMLERMSKVENALTKIVSAQDNIMREQDNSMAMIRSIEIETGQLAKQIAQITEGQSGQFPINNQPNLREHCNEIATERGKIIGERDGTIVGAEKEKDETVREKDEKEREKKRSEEEKN